MPLLFAKFTTLKQNRSKSLKITSQRPPKKWFWASEAKNSPNRTFLSTKICHFLPPDFIKNFEALQTSLPDLLRGSEGDRGRHRETEGDRGRQRETYGRQRETEGDRGRQRET